MLLFFEIVLRTFNFSITTYIYTILNHITSRKIINQVSTISNINDLSDEDLLRKLAVPAPQIVRKQKKRKIEHEKLFSCSQWERTRTNSFHLVGVVVVVSQHYVRTIY